jgi:hypothetical protein
MLRKLTLTVATLAISAGLAGQASAAASVVKLHTDADLSRFLSDTSSGVTTMAKSSSTDPMQRWDQDRHDLRLCDVQEQADRPLPDWPRSHRLPGRHRSEVRGRRAQPAVASQRHQGLPAAPQRRRREAQHRRQRHGRPDGALQRPARDEVAHPRLVLNWLVRARSRHRARTILFAARQGRTLISSRLERGWGRSASRPPGAALAGSRSSAPGGHAAARHRHWPRFGRLLVAGAHQGNKDNGRRGWGCRVRSRIGVPIPGDRPRSPPASRSGI